MERQINTSDRVILLSIYIYFLAGIVWHLIPSTKEIITPLTAYGLYLFSILLIIKERKYFSFPALLWFTFIGIATFSIEVVGVKTGKIFGEYSYGNILGIKLLGVPLIIAFNWALVLTGIYSFVYQYRSLSNPLKIILISLLTVTFDILLEPVAVTLDYWNWYSGNVPFQNYTAWFLIAFLFTSIGIVLKISINTRFISHYILAQTIFFLILNILL